MLNSSLSPWPCFTKEETEAVARTLGSNRVNYWTGQETRAFEREFAAWAGTDHAVALANGTLALDVALHGLGIGPGDDVIVTPRTFIASVSCVLNAGARPVFADVDPDCGNITADTIRAVATPATKAIIPVHLAGWPAPMPAINALAHELGAVVIEDCAQAHGAAIGDRRVGAWGHVAAWSFCQDKIMTTGGEGGMVTTRDKALWRRMWAFKDHGKSWNAVYEREHPPGYRWLHESIGTNWRMLEMQAVIGRIQLDRMEQWTAARIRNAARMRETLARFSGALRVPAPPAGVVHAYYRLYAYVRSDGLKPDWSRDRIVSEVQERGIPLGQGSCSEVYLEKAFDGLSVRPDQRLPIARELGETSLAFLTHPTLTDDDIDRVCAAVGDVMALAAR